MADEVFVQEHVRRRPVEEFKVWKKKSDDDIPVRTSSASWSGRFQGFGVGGGLGTSVRMTGLRLLTQNLSAEKCEDKLNDGNLICDFQRQGRQLLSGLRRMPVKTTHMRSSAA
uniref:Uncharacterized protein n=1 Tax=Pseudictyota dubia TaxID=2749911 RepID=A0A7R9VC19_9STRA|mmetsp:Transcript_10581/g.20253  ORF Transcript_10581/g.20253 Transcript_10581/m.20253 type:complete len:113 (+) Transcript_10581:3-341(+)